jgi:hypothetical protein
LLRTTVAGEKTSFGLEVAAFDSVLLAEPRPLLVGGQAVNLWAQVFLGERPELGALRPFLSRDCDVVGDVAMLQGLAGTGQWKVTFSRKGQASPGVGFLSGKDECGNDLVIEVLHTVRGLGPKDLEQEAVVDIEGKRYRTLSPVLLLKAKLANYLELPQREAGIDRNDLKHLRILVPCVAGYRVEQEVPQAFLRNPVGCVTPERQPTRRQALGKVCGQDMVVGGWFRFVLAVVRSHVARSSGAI